ncbi:Sec-independent protein translocase protein TatB [Exercitatus varius]|uniref:Sec-independent protein translocase protein TatB n=1 Tax=Exercitatus varius TaxID=67857 RepID=UPI00294B54FC|nr:Sec-independent protein translocase protein TatB [Exercitatus varius]MDG2961949.1 Sec-independent protein translocase protein TatB [Exercitatus varius]
MFDIGFSELLLVFIVGLVVLGPQRMPVAVRTVMKWVRTIRGLAANVQNELSQELKLQELQESIKKAENLNLKTLSPDLAKTVDELKASAEKMKADLDKQASDVNKTLEEQIKDVREANWNKLNVGTETSEKTSQNLTALESETLQIAENTESTTLNSPSLDEQLAKYIDQYHPGEDVQPQSSSEKNV